MTELAQRVLNKKLSRDGDFVRNGIKFFLDKTEKKSRKKPRDKKKNARRENGHFIYDDLYVSPTRSDSCRLYVPTYTDNSYDWHSILSTRYYAKEGRTLCDDGCDVSLR